MWAEVRVVNIIYLIIALLRLTTRWQIPLMMAYAISIHKAQGMTIAMLDVSFQGMFEYGQAYVALSRATDWENLYLRHFDASNVKAHVDVSLLHDVYNSKF